MATNSTMSPATQRARVTRGTGLYPRKRAVTACQVCRARRTKCDQKRPSCSFCQKTGAECVFGPTDESNFDQASLFIIDQLHNLEQKLDAHFSREDTLRAAAAAAGGGNTSGDDTASSSGRMTDAGEAVVNVSTDDTPPTPPPQMLPAPSSDEAYADRVNLLFPENLARVLQWPVFQDAAAQTAATPHTWSSPASSSLPGSHLQGSLVCDVLDLARCSAWLDDFFTHVHVKNPILDEPTTRRFVRKLSLEGPGWDAESCLALLVCANGALARPLSHTLSANDPDVQMAQTLFNTAQRRLGPTLTSTGLVQAQCVFLSGVFLMTLLRPRDAWTMFVHALAICRVIESSQNAPGMYPPQSLDGTAAQGQQQQHSIMPLQSLCWACWKSEQELRVELGIGNVNGGPDAHPHLFPTPPEACQGESEHAWYFFLSEISLWRLEMEARRNIADSASEPWPATISALDKLGNAILTRVETWRSSLPGPISIGTTSPETSLLVEQADVSRFVLRGRATYIHELVCWWALASLLNSDGASVALLGTWAAKALAFHLERLLTNRPGFYHRHHGTWLMIRSSARSAALLLGFYQTYPHWDLMPPNWHEAVVETIQMLHYWSSEDTELQPVVETLRYLIGHRQWPDLE